MTRSYDIRWFRESDLPYYIEGLNDTLYSLYDEERFNWKFREAPYDMGFIPIAVAEETRKKAPVAFNSFLPLQVRAREESFMVVQGCDGFVDREHRRRGLFQRTINFMTEELADKGPEILIGFNFAGSTGAAYKAGSRVACDIDRWYLDLTEVSLDRLEGGKDLSLVPTQIDDLHRLYQSWVGESDLIHFSRTLEYLKWRYEKSPLRSYQPYRVELDGVPYGYVVTSMVMDEDGSTELSIDDYIPEFSEQMPFLAILREVTETYDELGMIEMTTRRGAVLAEDVRRAGFKSEAEPRYNVIMKAISNVVQQGDQLFRRGVELTRTSDWHITKSDIF